MTGTTPELAHRLAALRAGFDESFARPNNLSLAGTENLLRIRVGGNPFGLKISEIMRIEVNRKRTPLPSALPGFQGIVGIRGRVIPVFSLRNFLALDGTSTGEEPWLVVCNPAEPVALSFSRLEGSITVSAPSWRKPSDVQKYVQGLLRFDSAVLPVLGIPSILEEITKNNEKEEKR